MWYQNLQAAIENSMHFDHFNILVTVNNFVQNVHVKC